MKKVKQRVTCWCLIRLGHSLAQSSVPLTLRSILWHRCHVASLLYLDEWVCWASGRQKRKRYTRHQPAQNLIGKNRYFDRPSHYQKVLCYTLYTIARMVFLKIKFGTVYLCSKLCRLLFAFKENPPLCFLTFCLTVSLLMSHREPVAFPKTWPLLHP